MEARTRTTSTAEHDAAQRPPLLPVRADDESPCTLDYARLARAKPRQPWDRAITVPLFGMLLFFVVAVPLVVPNLNSDRGRARKGLAQTAIASNGPMAQALKLYKSQVGAYPDSLSQLFVRPEDQTAAARWTGPYLEDDEGLKDPWGRAYIYQSPGIHNKASYDLWSVGEDGAGGTDDDIKNW